MSLPDHRHDYTLYGDHGPEDYGDPLAMYCKACGRLRDDAESLEDEELWHGSVTIRAAFSFGDWPA